MNNKGFTLIELLASVVILAMILVIAIPAINNLSSSIRKKHLENTIKNIEIGASKYAFDTKEKLVFVDKLVEEGYVSSDNENNIIYDQVNNRKLNCYLVKMEKSGNHYKANFQNDQSYEIDGKCDESKLNDLKGEVNIQIINDNIEITDNKWLKGNVILKALSNNLEIDCTKYKCNWTSISGNYKEGLEVHVDNIDVLNTRYNFQYIKINEDNHINRYTSSINLKIDNQSPQIYLEETKNSFNNNRLTIIANDGVGSGINGYFLELDQGNNCDDVTYVKNNEFNINEVLLNNKYLICVKDNVGNIATDYLIFN